MLILKKQTNNIYIFLKLIKNLEKKIDIKVMAFGHSRIEKKNKFSIDNKYSKYSR